MLAVGGGNNNNVNNNNQNGRNFKTESLGDFMVKGAGGEQGGLKGNSSSINNSMVNTSQNTV
jgi:hypothetical protein